MKSVNEVKLILRNKSPAAVVSKTGVRKNRISGQKIKQKSEKKLVIKSF